jgi:hypothetical protein
MAHWDDVGAALHEWLARGGVLYVNEDFTIFLEMSLYLALDPWMGLPSGRFVYQVLGKDELCGLPPVEEAAKQSSDWIRWYERDLFEHAIFRYYHPGVVRPL